MRKCAFRRMLKFVKRKTTNPQALEISNPSNLIVLKHKLVQIGDCICIMEGEKIIGTLDKNDPVLETLLLPPVHSSTSTLSLSTLPSSPPESQPYLICKSRHRHAEELEPPLLPSPAGVSPNKYKAVSSGFPPKNPSTLPQFQWHFSQNTSNSLDADQTPNYKSASVEQLFSTPVPASFESSRSQSILQPQGSHKYETITFTPGLQLPGSSSAQCNVEIRLGEERFSPPPPPPNRAPPAPLSFSPCHSFVFLPESSMQLDYTQVQSVSVEDPELAEMTLEELRKRAQDFDSYIQTQVQEKWNKERAHVERWIEEIAVKHAKSEAMNTIKVQMTEKKRPDLTQAFQQIRSEPGYQSPDPNDPVPSGYEVLYMSRANAPIRRQLTNESDEEFEDMKF